MKKINFKVVLIFTAALLFLAVCIPGAYEDVINPDGINWHTRSYNFIEGLLNEKYANTYQSYHPGISLMWISGPPLHILGNYFVTHGYTIYSKDTFLVYDYVAKLSVAVSTTILFLITLLYLRKIVSTKFLIVFCILSIFEPFLVGQRRLYHLDYLATHFLLVSFVAYYYFYFKSLKLPHLLVGTFFFVAAVLTKSTEVLFLPIPFLMMLLGRAGNWKKRIGFSLAIPVAAYLFLLMQFPALWNNPIKGVKKYEQKIVNGAQAVGVEGRKELGFSGKEANILLKGTIHKLPWQYYFQSAYFRLSPGAIGFMGLATLMFLFLVLKFLYIKIRKKQGKNPDNPFSIVFFSFLIIVLFLVPLTIAVKKSERYGLVFYPFLFFIVAYAVANINKWILLGISIIYLGSLVPQYIQIYPYYHAYADTYVGGTLKKYQTLDSSPFGVGLYEVYQSILADRGDNPAVFTVGANKSIKAIGYRSKNTLTPDCDADYYVAFSMDKKIKDICIGRTYYLMKTVRVGNMDYWYIYKRVYR